MLFRSFFILTVLVFSSAWLVSEQKKASTSIAKTILYPNLLEDINQVSQIKVRNNEREITLIKVEQEWLISENDNLRTLSRQTSRTIETSVFHNHLCTRAARPDHRFWKQHVEKSLKNN